MLTMVEDKGKDVTGQERSNEKFQQLNKSQQDNYESSTDNTKPITTAMAEAEDDTSKEDDKIGESSKKL